MDAGRARLASLGRGNDDALALTFQDQPGLTAAAELQVDIRKQLAVQKRAMEAPRRVVDLEAAAERVEADLGAGKKLAGHGHHADRALRGQRLPSAGRKPGIETFHVEGRVVDDQRGICNDVKKRRSDSLEQRLVLPELRPKALLE